MHERIFNLIKDLEKRRGTCWAITQVFIDQQDAHGIHDMGVEIQALERAIAELERIT